jgi:hypothetical protein
MLQTTLDRVTLFALARRLAGLGCLALGGLFLTLVALMLWTGGIWAHILYASRPIGDLSAGLGCLFVAYFLLKGYRNTAQQWRHWIARVLMVLFSVSLSSFIGEVGLRVYHIRRTGNNSLEKLRTYRRKGKPTPIRSTHPLAMIVEPSEDPKIVYELQSNLDLEFGHRRVRTNSDGLREDRDYPTNRLPNSVRIAGIGDSGMFGWDVEQGQEYMAVLETNLNRRQSGILYEVLNFAVPGYNTQLEVETMRIKALPYHPDIVIVGWCENDYSLPYFMLEKENYRGLDKSYLYHLLFKRNSANSTEFSPGITIHDQREFEGDKVTPELKAGTNVAGVERSMAELKELARSERFHLLVLGPMAADICGICKELAIPYFNTLEQIPDDKYPKDYLVHFMHPSPDGHRVLGEYLERELDRRGWLTPGSTAP